MVRFDPTSERFESFPLPSPNGAESAVDKLVVMRTQCDK
jgi:hypothetical protein